MSNGIFAGHKRTTQLAGLGCTGGCGCTKPTSGLGDIMGQSPAGFVSAVVLFGVGATVLYFMLKDAGKPAKPGPYSSMFASA